MTYDREDGPSSMHVATAAKLGIMACIGLGSWYRASDLLTIFFWPNFG